ncbi:NAD(P)H-hydrate dehydratase [Hirschia litorea]|uniref:Bifunctional NAD(P)H-hydrate repair enzyme n=1 Tax=Hirschia litorea TaxID=1199156 RepID=A0ABW2IHY8_9PROT
MRIISVNQMNEADRRTSEFGLSGASLMDAAGRACAEMVHNTWPDGRVIVLCGQGNNGGDGFVAYRYLEQLGRQVSLFLIGDVGDLSGDAEGAAELVLDDIQAASVLLDKSENDSFELSEGDVVVDAMLGAGNSRPLEGEFLQLVQLINATKAHVLSIDVPTGVRGDTGALSSEAICADITVTFNALKTAHVIESAASLCGAISVVDVGISEETLAYVGDEIFLNRPDVWADKLPWPTRSTHKHQRGSLGVVAGEAGKTGAARLAARAGLRVGAGLVTLLGHASAIPEMAASSLAVMTKDYADIDELYLLSASQSGLVFGPAAGVTEGTRFKVASLLQTGVPIVLDADALTVFKDDPSFLFGLLHEKCVLTPHEGEFESLFPGLLAEVGNKINATRTAANIAGCVVVLKGADSVIASPDGAARVNVHGSPFLATAGSGDVLAGMIGSWMAQGVSAYDSASASVWIHGEASLSGGAGLISEDLMDYFPRILTRIYEEIRPSNVLWERKIEFST